MFREIFPRVFFFESQGFGSNVFLLAGKKNALVDSSAGNPGLLKSSLAKLGFDCRQIDLLLHTHGHADHFANDFLFKNSEIRMHKFDAERVNAKDSGFTFSAIVPDLLFPKIKSFFKEQELIDLGTFKLRVVFTPGHTKGSVCFFEETKKLFFSGDTLFKSGFGRTDSPSGNARELKNSIEKISKLDFNLLLPGHGELLKGSQKSNIREALSGLANSFL